jgi:cysteine protease ATG4
LEELTIWQRCKSTVFHAGYAVANSTRGLSISTHLDPGVPVYIFGVMYDMRSREGVQEMLSVFRHILLLTYRKEFVPILKDLTYDTSWGCMLRTGQMMLYQALCRAFPKEDARMMVGMFRDLPHEAFSIHRIALLGQNYGVKCGKWFSPTVMCNVMRDLVDDVFLVRGGLSIYMAHDQTVSIPEINRMLPNGAVLILIPLMLGFGQIQETYHGSLLRCLEMKSSVGVVGGKPKLSLYFVGHHGTRLVYLDPHTPVQPAFTDAASEGQTTTKRPTLVEIAQLDPSMFLGFVVRNKHELDAWTTEAKALTSCKWPMFSLQTEEKGRGTLVRQSRAIARTLTSPPPAGFEQYTFV